VSVGERATETGSSAVVVTKDAKTVFEWTDDAGHRPTETMSVTKLVVATVIGAAFCRDDRGVLDESVAQWLPEWKNDERSTISLRILLGHRSGLRSIPPVDFVDVADSYAAALELPLDGHPTEAFVYNNLAFNLLGLITQRALGESIADAAERLVFAPLDFREHTWLTDNSGNPRCHFGISCRADDLAKVAQLYIDPGGILPEWWPDRAMRSGLSCYAQLAWIRAGITEALTNRWRDAGIDDELIERAKPLVDREMDFDEFWSELNAAFDGAAHVLVNQLRTRGVKEWEGSTGPIVGYGHDGDGGQRLVIFPEQGGVAVRLRENLETGSDWSAFPGDVQEVLTNAVR
jgi:CubicO group peptidase (beta-lactamase class C family)